MLRDVGQDQPLSMQHALTPSKNALVQRELLAHPDSDVRVSLASCLTQIVRIAAPQAPYGDDQMKVTTTTTLSSYLFLSVMLCLKPASLVLLLTGDLQVDCRSF